MAYYPAIACTGAGCPLRDRCLRAMVWRRTFYHTPPYDGGCREFIPYGRGAYVDTVV